MKKDVSRREFANNLAKALIFGGFVHFSMSSFAAIMPSGSSSKVKDCPGGRAPEDVCSIVAGRYGKEDDDYCPGGGPLEDVCRIADGYSDYCPGESTPEDECSSSGKRSQKFGGLTGNRHDDYCDTGLPKNDICDNTIEGSDQCLGQGPEWDVCDASQSDKFDVCYSGLHSDDACELNGGAAGDECPGGGAERDTCMSDKSGDECSINHDGDPSDYCKPKEEGEEDVCGSWWQRDVCYLGNNDQNTHIGGGDLCQDNKILGVIPRGNGGDTCLDGSNEQDDCGGEGEEGNEVDMCIPNATGEKDDLCRPLIIGEKGSIVEDSDDLCYDGLPSSDECKPEPIVPALGDQDECPKGLAPADECNRASLDPDECPGGASCADECKTGLSDEDECPGGRDEVDVCLPLVDGTDECGMRDPDECSQADEAGCEDGVFGSDECAAEDIPDRCTAAQPDHAE